MQRGLVMVVACSAATFGCGDGIGQPIVERDAPAPHAGSSGSSSGDAGSGFRGDFPFGGRGSTWGGESGRGVPPDPSCPGAPEWPSESQAAEQAFHGYLNFAREFGISCSTETAEVVPTVAMNTQLQCAARSHSRDIAERGFFDHVNPEGIGPEDRIRRAGYSSFRVAGESIARSDGLGEGMDPYRVFDELFAAGPAECQNLFDSRFDSVGIGYYGGLWTLDFAGP